MANKNEHPLYDIDPEMYVIFDWLLRDPTLIRSIIEQGLNSMSIKQFETTIKLFYGLSYRKLKIINKEIWESRLGKITSKT